MKKREFYVVVEKDEDGFFVGEVTQLTACYSQGETLEELMDNMKDIICLCLEHEERNVDDLPEFVGVQRVVV